MYFARRRGSGWEEFTVMKMARIFFCLAWALGAAGAAVATLYATPIEGIGSLACGSEFFSCGETLQSGYARIFGVPIGIPAVGYFALVAGMLGALGVTRRESLRVWITWLLVPGLVGSVFFLVIMTVVLKSFCLYCLLTHGFNVLLLLTFAPKARWNASWRELRAAILPVGIACVIGFAAAGGAFAANEHRKEQARRFLEQNNVW